MGKIVITKQNNRLLLALFSENKPYLFETASVPGEEGILGNIYLAKVKDVVSAIKGVFLSVSSEQTVYLPFSECEKALIANRDFSEKGFLKQGDEVVVQISKEALKTKQPSATANLSLTGQYCVCNYFGHGLHYSKKISPEKKAELNSAIRMQNIEGRKQYSFTVRTNAECLTTYEPLYEEMNSFITLFNNITETFKHRTCHSCFYQKETEILSLIKNLPLGSYDEIVTDETAVYQLLKDAFSKKVIASPKTVRLYEDELLPLSKLYSLDTHIKEALGKKVWLPCGGYLVIEPTEAMVAIDVNSGKAEEKRKKSSNYLLTINLEAAKEVARQLRLRNYSGMIMVDFINMESEEDNQKLLYTLGDYLKEDKVHTRLVDMTALGIVEITRKKVSKPLSDFFRY